MKNITSYFYAFFIFCFAFISCQKIELRPSDVNHLLLQQKEISPFASGGGFHLVSAPYIPHDDDSIERPTTLGIHLTNPYLIPNMQQAYINLGLSSSKALINNWYVRFLPSSIDQLAVLDSTMDALGVELFDTPVDYDVTYEGDYYHVKFKNDYASIRGMRGIRLWQMLFPVKKTLGIYSSDKNNVLYVAKLSQTLVNINGTVIDVTTSNKSTRYWAAATTLNSVQEYRDYATSEQIGLPATGIRIVLSNYGKGGGFTPMYGKRGAADVVDGVVEYFLSPLASALSGIVNIFKDQVDICGSYNFRGPDNVIGYPYLRSDEMKGLFYHELTHAAHYNALGNGWYTAFVANVVFEIIQNLSSGYAPYGDGTNGNSPQIALGESWAYYIGHIFSDKKYDSSADCQSEQDGGLSWCYFNGTGHPHLDVEENFNPNLAADRFEWIPQGLFYDLMDPANETSFPVTDQVSGYTNSQMFSAFQPNIYTLSDYRARLLQTLSNSTSQYVTALFSQYHY